MVVRKTPQRIFRIAVHLLHMLGQRGIRRQHLFRILCLEVFELHQAVVRIIISARYARHLKVGTTFGVVLLDGEGVAHTQIARYQFEEGAADEVLVYLIEHLCGELAEVLLEVVLNERFEPALFRETLVDGGVAHGTAVDTVQNVVIVHIDAAHGQVGERHAVGTLQGRHAQVEEADGIEVLVEELLLVELAGKVGNIVV